MLDPAGKEADTLGPGSDSREEPAWLGPSHPGLDCIFMESFTAVLDTISPVTETRHNCVSCTPPHGGFVNRAPGDQRWHTARAQEDCIPAECSCPDTLQEQVWSDTGTGWSWL